MTQVYLAKNFIERSFGLILHVRLKLGEALKIPNCSRIHTFFMRYAIDAVFVNPDGLVLCISTFLPWRISRRVPRASACYELLAGEAVRLDIRVGQKLKLNND